MKKYKLLKDLPGIKAGTEICLAEDSSLYFPDWLWCFTEEYANNHPDFFEEIKEGCTHARAIKDLLKDGQMLCPDCGACYAIKSQPKEKPSEWVMSRVMNYESRIRSCRYSNWNKNTPFPVSQGTS